MICPNCIDAEFTETSKYGSGVLQKLINFINFRFIISICQVGTLLCGKLAHYYDKMHDEAH